MKIAQFGRCAVFTWWGWRVEGWRGFEYWDRLCLGCVYVLKYRPDEPEVANADA